MSLTRLPDQSLTRHPDLSLTRLPDLSLTRHPEHSEGSRAFYTCYIKVHDGPERT